MITTNSIWITETQRQLESLQILRPSLLYKDAVCADDCNIRDLPKYDMVFFLLTPGKIGNKFFIEAVKEVLSVRKNSKTIFLAIDDCFRLDEQELYKVILELKTSLQDVLTHPTIFTISSYYAALYTQYMENSLSIEDLKQNRDILIPASDGKFITGRLLQEENVKQLFTISKMQHLYNIVQEFSKGIRESGIDASKKNYLVIGREKSGKSFLTNLLRNVLDEDIHITEEGKETKEIGKYFDGLLIIIDADCAKSVPYVEKIYSSYVGIEKTIVVNKMDEFMYYEKTRPSLEEEITSSLRKITSDPIYFISAYYYEQSRKYELNEITIDDLLNNPEIVIADSLHFPIDKVKNKRDLLQLLFTSSGCEQLLQKLEA